MQTILIINNLFSVQAHVRRLGSALAVRPRDVKVALILDLVWGFSY